MRVPIGAKVGSLIAIVGLLAGCGSGGDTTVIKNGDGTTIIKEAPATTDGLGGDSGSGGGGARPIIFQTPTGNIGCAVTARFVNCVIQGADWAPTTDPKCPPSAGRFVTMESGPPSVQCGAPDVPNGRVLDYGSQVDRGRFTCLSEETGVTCDGGSHAFFLSQQRIDGG